ncbi:MAG: ABC transporter permease [Acidobacteriota bacterium]
MDPFVTYRLLLRIFPRSFRSRWGPSMERDFADHVRVRRQSGEPLGVRFWISLGWDAATGAAAEWLALLRPTSAPHPDYARHFSSPTATGGDMSSLTYDLRLAVRQLVRRPTYAVSIVLLMALGIAGNAAVFRMVNGLFLRPLPFDEAHQLVDLNETAPQWDLEFLNIAFRDFDRWRAENKTFDAMSATRDGGGNLLIDGAPQRVSYLLTTHDIDEVLRLGPRLGRFYTSEEDHPSSARVAMLSFDMWQERLGGRDDVLGALLTLDGEAVQVIGVLPEEADFIRDVDLWMPLRQTRDDWFGWGLGGIGRLRSGVSVEQAEADLLTVHKGMIPEFEVNEISFPRVAGLRDRFLGEYRLGSGFLLGAMGLVLLIACANIAALVIVHTMSRARELTLRAALGASRGRIVRQLTTESLLLALLGSFVGVGLGVLGSNVLVEPMAQQFPEWVSFDLDGRFVAFTAILTGSATLLFGLVPALRASRLSQGSSLSQRSTQGRWFSQRMNWIVGAEVALALVLLVLGGLAMLDVVRLGFVDPGYETDGVVSYTLSLPEVDYDAEARRNLLGRMLPALEAVPGIESAAVASTMPLQGHWGSFFQAQAAPARSEEEGDPVVLKRIVSPSYFETMGLEMSQGRTLDPTDGREGAFQAVVVNETFVRTHLGHLDDPVGALIVEGTSVPDEPNWLTVVGVAKDVKHYGVDTEMRPGLYLPVERQPLSFFHVVLHLDRERAELASVADQVRAVTADIDPKLPVFNLEAMQDLLDESLWTRRAGAWMIGVFSTVALLLAVAGIYGVVSHTVGRRRREIGIRMAVGAERKDVLRQVVSRGMALVLTGVAVGLTASFLLARALSSALVGVTAREPGIYVSVTVLIVLVAAVANYLPARRAAAIDPATVLRRD